MLEISANSKIPKMLGKLLKTCFYSKAELVGMGENHSEAEN